MSTIWFPLQSSQRTQASAPIQSISHTGRQQGGQAWKPGGQGIRQGPGLGWQGGGQSGGQGGGQGGGQDGGQGRGKGGGKGGGKGLGLCRGFPQGP